MTEPRLRMDNPNQPPRVQIGGTLLSLADSVVFLEWLKAHDEELVRNAATIAAETATRQDNRPCICVVDDGMPISTGERMDFCPHLPGLPYPCGKTAEPISRSSS